MRSALACLLLAVANAGTSPEGKTWLEAKAKEDGVVTLESGLMYKVLRDGDGENHPKASTSCECHYEGKLIDGTVFDSSYERGSPTSFAPNQVVNCVEIKCRGASLPRPNHDLHAIDATPARRRAEARDTLVDFHRSSKAGRKPCNSWSKATSGRCTSRLN